MAVILLVKYNTSAETVTLSWDSTSVQCIWTCLFSCSFADETREIQLHKIVR